MLKKTYATHDEIPEALRDHYTEQEDGTFLLDVEGGLKTDQDVARLDRSLKAEREAHKATKQRIQAFGDLTPEAVQELRDQVEDLTAQVEAGGKPDEKALEPIIARRVAQQVRPIERERDALRAEKDQLSGVVNELRTSDRRRRLSDTFRKVTVGEKGVKLRAASVLEDVELLAERIFEEDERGEFVVRDGVGFTPGLSPGEWLRDLHAAGTRAHWFPENEGAGANGSSGKGSGGGANPLLGDSPNMTEFGKLVNSDPQKAVRFAIAAKKTELLPPRLRPRAA